MNKPVRHRTRPASILPPTETASPPAGEADHPPAPANAEKSAYPVGYGKPPTHSRFPKGQSGNPRGRPKGVQNMLTLLKGELSDTISIRENGKVKKLSRRGVIVKQMVKRAMEGNPKAISEIAKLDAQITRMDAESSPDQERANSQEELGDAAVLAAFVRMTAGMASNEVLAGLPNTEDGDHDAQSQDR